MEFVADLLFMYRLTHLITFNTNFISYKNREYCWWDFVMNVNHAVKVIAEFNTIFIALKVNFINDRFINSPILSIDFPYLR